MQIKRTDQPVPTTKVEDDKRVEVSKLKPGGQQIPDSFEQGKSRTSDSDNGASKPAEPLKKAGQRTGAQLALKMAEARLGEAGIRSPGSAKLKEFAGRKEPGKDEQDAADPIKPRLNRDNPRETGTSADGSIPHLISTQDKFPEASKDARSNHDGLHNQEMQNFLKEHGFETPPSGSGPGPAGRPGALDPGGPTGPADPLASANERMSEMLGRSKQTFDRLVSQVSGGISGSDEPAADYGKDMVATENVIHNKDGSTTNVTDIYGTDSHKHIEETERAWGTERVENETVDGIGCHIESHHEEFRHNSGILDVHDKLTQINTDGSTTITETYSTVNLLDGTMKEKTKSTTTDANGNVISTTNSSSTTDKDGKTTDTTTTTEKGKTTTTTTTTTATPSPGMPDPDAPQNRDSRLSPLNLPKKPRIQGDKDPSPEATTLADAAPNIYGRVGEGMVSQPNSQNESGQSSGHLSSDSQVAGGAGEVWHGVTHTENEADALSNQELKPKAEDDEEKKKSTTSFGDIAKRNKNLISNLKDN